MIRWLRHGESTWNAAGRLQYGDPTPPLTETGRRQARDAADRLQGAPVWMLLSSPARRAVETAEIVAEVLGLPVELDDRLVERGRDETVESVRSRLADLLHERGDGLLVVSHGDTIAIAVEQLTGVPCAVPQNAQVHVTDPLVEGPPGLLASSRLADRKPV
ncbi:histidine phosphatase family protein [Aeromicrobium sp. JJY06]|uniref:histidine phosphatase family protein n=1 Tax=Aeromicrobium sp. JJY06 TaxID=3373478 RepID=UPI00376F1A13